MLIKAESNLLADVSVPNWTKSPWFLVYTRPRLEAVVLENLQRQSFEVYLPLFKHLKKSELCMSVAFEPLFPRYVFFRPSHVAQSIGVARSTRGVANIVSFGHEPATIGADTLIAIRQFEQGRNASDLSELSPFRPGVRVRFDNPAFHGLHGLVKTVSSQRISVLLEFLGRQQVLVVDQHQLLAA